MNASSIVGVTEVDHSPLFCNTLPEDGSLTDFIRAEVKDNPRQALEPYYRINGAMYIASVLYYQTYGDFYHEKCYAYVMGKDVSVDIDDEMDFRFAELLMRI